MTPNITNWPDFRLNKGVAELVYPTGKVKLYINDTKVVVRIGTKIVAIVDYCDNWNDLMPLMIKHDVLYQLSKLANQREMAECLYMVLLAKQEKDSE